MHDGRVVQTGTPQGLFERHAHTFVGYFIGSTGMNLFDAWMSMARMGDEGEPNALPVDAWGIRVNEKSQLENACMSCGGATNAHAAVYAVEKAVDWLRKDSPPSAMGMTFSEAGPVPAEGNIARQMFMYTTFVAPLVTSEAVMNEDGMPKWYLAPSPHGAYWGDGMKVGYQDVGSWTLMQATPVDRAKAAWLSAQVVTSVTVDIKKSDVGMTFIRELTVNGAPSAYLAGMWHLKT